MIGEPFELRLVVLVPEGADSNALAGSLELDVACQQTGDGNPMSGLTPSSLALASVRATTSRSKAVPAASSSRVAGGLS